MSMNAQCPKVLSVWMLNVRMLNVPVLNVPVLNVREPRPLTKFGTNASDAIG